MSTAEILAETYFTPAQAAEKLGLKVETVWKQIRTGRLRATGGHRRRIAACELARILSETPDESGRE